MPLRCHRGILWTAGACQVISGIQRHIPTHRVLVTEGWAWTRGAGCMEWCVRRINARRDREDKVRSHHFEFQLQERAVTPQKRTPRFAPPPSPARSHHPRLPLPAFPRICAKCASSCMLASARRRPRPDSSPPPAKCTCAPEPSAPAPSDADRFIGQCLPLPLRTPPPSLSRIRSLLRAPSGLTPPTQTCAPRPCRSITPRT